MEEQKQNGKIVETVKQLQGIMNEQGSKNKEKQVEVKAVDTMKQAESKAEADNIKEQVKA